MSKKILIIDDERGVVLLLQTCLAKKGYSVDTAYNVSEGAKKIIEGKPDMVITDDIMPGIRGSELVDILKKSDETQHIPIIMISGKGEMIFDEKLQKFKWSPNNTMARNRGEIPEGKTAEALAAAYHVDDFIPKPFKMEMVEQVVEEVFKRREQ